MSVDNEYRIRNVTAVLGPTNTGKTHLAIERMLGHETGMIGLPLRLLAREVYDKIVLRIGADKVALITGEEKIKPENARYWVCTVEAMPLDIQTDFLAIDEIQLAADPERGHVFTDRLLHARGKQETLMLGASTMRDAIADLIPGANFVTRPRLSKLTYAGEKKITRLPPRTAVVTFSANDVYAIAELMRRQRGGAAVVLGALSPRTRNAQVALFQNGDVDFIIATDAIGMGLNLDVDHVALAQLRKFDGQSHRELNPAELGQIAGRAGRHMKDGSFGVTGGIESLQPDLIERLENHSFESIKLLQWRARDLDFASVEHLRESLRTPPREVRLQRARMADDVMALEALSADREITDLANTRKAVELLWDVCQVPDFRKISSQNHAEMVSILYKSLRSSDAVIPEDWIAMQVAVCNNAEGDIDTLSQRLAHIRTWTYVANRPTWLKDATHWQEKTRAVEDRLSDALHVQLMERFVDRRTSALVRGMRDKDELYAEIAADGAINVEKHFVGRLKGFRFQPETQAEDIHGKASRAAAAHVVGKELVMRARRVASAKSEAFKLNRLGQVLWREDVIAHLVKGDDPLKPQVVIDADEHLTPPDKETVQERLNTWVAELIGERLKPLVEISKAEDITGMARGIAFRMTESYGVLRREAAAEELKSLDQASRASLRKYGVRFGAFNIFFPLLLKPAAAELALTLSVLNAGAANGLSADALPEAPKAGLTSVPVVATLPEAYYRTLGFHVCGPRAVRVDMLERLADMIRPLLAWRAADSKPGSRVPQGSTGDGGFVAMPAMMSILGCSPAELAQILTTLGFRAERKPLKTAIKSPPPAPVDVAATTSSPGDALVPAPAAAAIDGGVATPDVAVDTVPEAISVSAAAEVVLAVAAEAVPPSPLQPTASVDDGTAEASPAALAAAPVADVPTVVASMGDAAPAEEPMIDVWRPRRKFQGGPRQQTAGRDDADASASRRRGPPRGDRRPDQRGSNSRRPETTVVSAGAAVAPGSTDAAAASATARPDQGVRRDDGPSTRRDGGRRDAPRTGAGPATPSQDRRDGGGKPAFRGERRDDDRRGGKPTRFGDRSSGSGGGGRSPQQFSSGPSKTVRGPDPDSPFAALMALRASLEKRPKE